MLNIKKCFYVLFALLFMNSALAESEKAAVEQTYKDWCNAISEANGNYKKMVKFYAPDAVLLATFSPKILVNKNGGLNEYFKTFTKTLILTVFLAN